MKDKIEYYKDSQNKWRWRVIALENGETIGMSHESYARYADAVANARRLGTMSTREFSAEVLDA